MLSTLLPAELFGLLLVFVRMGAAMMILAGFGEQFVSARVRLVLALVISFLVTPVVRADLPGMPAAPAALLVLIAGEVVIGLFLGTITRLFLAALATAGMVVAYMSALANALTNDPAAAQQGSIAGTFLSLVGLLIIFTLDLHHLMLSALVGSYQLFVPGQALPIGDISDTIARLVSETFLLAFQIGAPFVVTSITFYLGMGLLARLMPQIQIFFIAMPIQIAAGLVIIFLSLPVAMAWFAERFRETIGPFAGPFAG